MTETEKMAQAAEDKSDLRWSAGTGNGMQTFRCSLCPYAAVEEWRIAEHYDEWHEKKEREKRELSVMLFDARGDRITHR